MNQIDKYEQNLNLNTHLSSMKNIKSSAKIQSYYLHPISKSSYVRRSIDWMHKISGRISLLFYMHIYLLFAPLLMLE